MSDPVTAKARLFALRSWLDAAALETMRRRNAEYATEDEPIRNYVVAAEVAGIATSRVILARTAEKLVRLGQALERDRRDVIAEECREVLNMMTILAYAAGIEAPEPPRYGAGEMAFDVPRDANGSEA